MFNFDTNHILTGYIKEYLSEFHLPKYRVYTKEDQDFFDRFGFERPEIFETTPDGEHARYMPYIKDSQIQKYVNKKWKVIRSTYNFGEFTPNITRNLPIKNNIYDTETHEYLGDFLRFIRDYKDINLMPLYNCFSNQICNNIKLTIKNPDDTENITATFNCYDNKYKIYILPVKLFKEYTVAIDCGQPVEMCCVIYGNYLNTKEQFKDLPFITYQKYNNLSFNTPVLYSKLHSTDIIQLVQKDNNMELAQNEANLRLLIKMPISNDSSITILEGDYRNYNDRIIKRENDSEAAWSIKTNHTVSNFEKFDEHEYFFKPITNLQLLQMNTKTSYPFADRLIEYLIGQAITEEDPICDNITRFQKIYEQNVDRAKHVGVWEQKYRNVIYEFINKYKNKLEINHDILGYADRAAEKYYISVPDKDGNREMFAYADIYPEETKMVEERAK